MLADPHEALVAKLRRARRITVEVAPGKRVHLLRPQEVEMLGIMRAREVTPDDVCRAADGWDGFTEADLLGPELGAADPVPFDRAVFQEWVRDRIDVLGQLATAISDAITAHFERRAAVSGN